MMELADEFSGNGISVLCVHAAIAYGDAIAIFAVGRKSKSGDHRDAAPFLASVVPIRSAEDKAAMRAFEVILSRKDEAWFLFDEDAIRLAADHPNGRVRLHLPTPREVQRIARPKERLGAVLMLASGASGRRLDDFRTRLSEKKYLVAQNIQDFSPLRLHGSFRRFETMLANAVTQNGWGWN